MCIDVQCITCSLQHIMVEYLYDHNKWSICRFTYKDSILCNRKINMVKVEYQTWKKITQISSKFVDYERYNDK